MGDKSEEERAKDAVFDFIEKWIDDGNNGAAIMSALLAVFTAIAIEHAADEQATRH